MEGLEGLARKLRRMASVSADAEENVDNSVKIPQKTDNSGRKSRNVSEIDRAVDIPEFQIGQAIQQVYDPDRAGRQSAREAAAAGEAGFGTRLGWPEPDPVPPGRDGGRDAGSALPRGLAADWMAGGTAQVGEPAEDAGRSGASPPGEISWAELADKAFRRDSRRYDGGFYLY